jgi:hypothetical protein
VQVDFEVAADPTRWMSVTAPRSTSETLQARRGNRVPTVARSLGVLKLASLACECRNFVDANASRPHWLQIAVIGELVHVRQV